MSKLSYLCPTVARPVLTLQSQLIASPRPVSREHSPLLYVVFVVAILWIAAPSNPLLRAQVSFYQTPSTPSVLGPVFEGDFNGDGKLDLISLNGAVLLGQGDGTFSQTNVNLPTGTDSMAIGDFNGDGKPDILAANGFYLSVLLGNGDGTFQPPKNTYAAVSLYAFALADVNQDGKLDILALNGSNIMVFLGSGDGTFSAATQYPVGIANVVNIVPGDFNGDGKVDMATVYGSSVSVLLGNGDGSFQSPIITTFTGFKPILWALTNGNGSQGSGAFDVNRDGKVDLVVGVASTTAPFQTFTLLGNGDGTFQAPADPVSVSGTSIAFADLNGDGNIDFVVASSMLDAFTTFAQVFLGNGDGSFTAGQSYYLGLASTSNIVIGDFNNDGKLDLAVAGAMLLGNGDGTFQGAPAAQPGGFVRTADFNADGNPDMAVVSYTELFIFLGDGKSHFSLAHTYPAPGGIQAIADMNGDGKPDLLFSKGAPALQTWSFSVMLGKGDGSFGAPIITSGGSSGGGGAVLATADFNGDHKLDVAAVSGGQSVEIFIGKGDGTFSAPVSYFAGSNTSSVLAADFNGDGKIDLAVSGDAGLAILLGNGDGTFQPATFVVTTSTFGFATADVNNDGKIDIVATQFVLLGNGDGTFNVVSQPNVFPGVLVDLNGDGKLDLATLGFNQTCDCGTTYVILGNGDGTFGNPISFATDDKYGLALTFLATADFNRDGRPDLAAGVGPFVGAPFAVAVLLNTTQPVAGVSFSPSTVTFSTQRVGTSSSPVVLTLTNTGTAALNVTGVTITGADAGEFGQTNNCTVVAAGGRCAINITFTPIAVGAANAVINVADDASGGSQTVSLSGTSEPGPDFGIAPSSGSPNSQTVSVGQTANFTVAISPLDGFTGTVNLTCSTTPVGTATPKCSLPASVQVTSGTPVSVQVAVSTTPSVSAGMTLHSHSQASKIRLAFGTVLFALVAGLVNLRRRRALVLRTLVVCLALFSMFACGGGGGSSGASSSTRGTPAGTYTVTLAGSSGSETHNATLTVVVQ
jgi:hypothetical protein